MRKSENIKARNQVQDDQLPLSFVTWKSYVMARLRAVASVENWTTLKSFALQALEKGDVRKFEELFLIFYSEVNGNESDDGTSLRHLSFATD